MTIANLYKRVMAAADAERLALLDRVQGARAIVAATGKS